jgi:hypothetical protein
MYDTLIFLANPLMRERERERERERKDGEGVFPSISLST